MQEDKKPEIAVCSSCAVRRVTSAEQPALRRQAAGREPATVFSVRSVCHAASRPVRTRTGPLGILMADDDTPGTVES